ncbi:MAG: nuclear transport factor 2 family protein [Rhodobacter sp.]|nr:nuclear transport factor 2 family protein [Rhodobacter sp.]
MTEAEALVMRLLKALEARDFDTAAACFAPGGQMVFPGGAIFATLDQLIDWARPRYQRVAKRIERMDTAEAADGTVVICQGTLHGLWPDGTPFEGIRFADWFLIRDGLIVRQHVWNDLAENRGA